MAVRVTDTNGLVWNATIDDSELNRIASRIESRIGGMSQTVQQEGTKMGGMFDNLIKGAALFFTAQQGTQLVNAIVKVRGEFQQLEIAFGTMLQSKEKADSLMREMVNLAANTPFGLQDVAAGAKQLLAYGFAAEDITDNITRLGNVASGVGSQIGDLIYLYGTLKASGRVTQMDINQFAGRGIPIYAELSKVLGVSVESVREMVSAGKVGFPQIEKAFRGMTDSGGMFFNLMEAQSKSLTGQISNLQDNIAQMFNEIGQSNEGILSSGIGGVAYLVENYKEIGKILGVLVTTYGAYRAALILTSVAQATKIAGNKALVAADLAATLSGKSVTAGMVLQAGATNLATAAYARLTAVFAANPIGLVVTAVAALGAAMYFLADTSTASEKAQSALNKRNEEAAQSTEDLKNKTNDLASAINSSLLTMSDRVVAYQKLQQLYPELLSSMSMEEFLLRGTTDQQKILNAEVSKKSKSKLLEDYEDALAAAKKLETSTVNIRSSMGGGGSSYIKDNTMSKEYRAAVEYAQELKKQIDRIVEAEKLATMSEAEKLAYYTEQKKALDKQIRQHEEFNGALVRAADGSISVKDNLASWSILGTINQFNTLLGQINSLNKTLGGNGAPIRTVATIEEEINKLKEAQKGASTNKNKFDFITGTYSKGYSEYSAEIKKLEEEKRKITGESNKSELSASKKAVTTAKQSAEEQKRAIESVTDAEKKATIDRMVEGEKQVAEIKARYEAMRQALRDAGVAQGNEAFGKIDTLENQALGDNQYQRDTDDIKKHLDQQKNLYQQFNDFKEKAGIEAANKEFAGKIQLDKTFNQIISESLANHLKAQAGQQATAFTQARELMLRDFDNENQQSDADKNRQILVEFASYYQKREAIISSYNEKVKLLGTAATAEQIAEINRQKQIALGGLDSQQAQIINQSKLFFDGLVLNSKDAVKAQIASIESILKSANLDPVTRGKLLNDLANMKKLLIVKNEDLDLVQLDQQLEDVNEQINRLEKNTPNATQELQNLYDRKVQLGLQKTDANLKKINDRISQMSELGGAVSQLGATLSALGNEGGNLSQLGGVLEGLGSSMGTITKLFEGFKNGDYAKGGSGRDSGIGGYVQVVQAAIQMIEGIASAAKQRKEKLKEFYRDLTGMQNEYNLSLIEETRLRTEMGENVFIKDYAGRMTSGLEAAIKANDAYQQSLTDLQKASVKVGTVKKNDWKKILSNTVSGAAAGATIGGPWGAAIGAVAGFVTGLFSKKRVDVYDGLLKTYPDLISAEGKLNEQRAKALLSGNLLNAESKQLLQNTVNLNEEYKKSQDQIKGIVSELAGSLGDDLRNSLVDAFKNGTDAAVAFGDSVEKVLENIVAQMLFNELFNDSFTDLQKRMEASFGLNGDNNFADDIADFYKTYGDRAEVFNAALKQAQEEAKEQGLDIFQPTKNAGSSNSVSGAIQQITQQQADVLTGQFYAQTTVLNDINAKIPKNYFADSISMMNQQFDTLNKIESNTKDTVSRLDKAVVSLESIDKKMNNTANQAAAAGYKI